MGARISRIREERESPRFMATIRKEEIIKALLRGELVHRSDGEILRLNTTFNSTHVPKTWYVNISCEKQAIGVHQENTPIANCFQIGTELGKECASLLMKKENIATLLREEYLWIPQSHVILRKYNGIRRVYFSI